MNSQVNLRELADGAKFNAFHLLVLIWCSLIIIFDGYDLTIVGVALPSIMEDMQVGATAAGFMVSSALFGMMFGAILFGSIADRFGRRNTIAFCIALFSVFTVLSGFTSDSIWFSVTRFIAGLGIGGVMPNTVAHMTEFAPKKYRATLVTMMFSGYAIGGMAAAILGKGFIASHGWQSVFFAAGLPILLLPFFMKTFPESISYLAKTKKDRELRQIAFQLNPNLKADPELQVVVPSINKSNKAPLKQLFADGRGFSTVMFWLSFFMSLFMVYALGSWLTKLMASAGYSLGSALTFMLVLNIGAMAGAIGGGWLADKLHIKPVLIAMYALSAISVVLLGVGLPKSILFFVVGLAGASTIGTQILANAYTGQFYPSEIRATGLGWALGVGRSGAIVAPIIIGILVSLNLPLTQNFVAIAIPGLIGMFAVMFVNKEKSAATQEESMVDLSLEPGLKA